MSRWVLIIPVLVLALLATGVVLLLQRGQQLDTNNEPGAGQDGYTIHVRVIRGQ